jgi:hypothetical protein
MMSVLVYGAETKTWTKAYMESTFTTGLSNAQFEASSVIMQSIVTCSATSSLALKILSVLVD